MKCYISYDNGKIEKVSRKEYMKYLGSHTKGLLNYVMFMAEDDYEAFNKAWDYWGWDNDPDKTLEEDAFKDWYQEIWGE